MGHIFINHRRDLNEADAEILFLHLKSHFPEKRLFIDRRGLDSAADWKKRLKDIVAGTDVMVVVIGDGTVHGTPAKWLEVEYPPTHPRSGTRRLDDPDDFVRYEIVEAVDRGIPLVPVLVNGTQMPPRDQRLPFDLWPLTKPQATTLRTRGGVKPEIDATEIAKVIRVRLAERARPRRVLRWVAMTAAAIALPIGVIGGLWASDTLVAPKGDAGSLQRQLEAEKRRGVLIETKSKEETKRADAQETSAKDYQIRLRQALNDRDQTRAELAEARKALGTSAENATKLEQAEAARSLAEAQAAMAFASMEELKRRVEAQGIPVPTISAVDQDAKKQPMPGVALPPASCFEPIRNSIKTTIQEFFEDCGAAAATCPTSTAAIASEYKSLDSETKSQLERFSGVLDLEPGLIRDSGALCRYSANQMQSFIALAGSDPTPLLKVVTRLGHLQTCSLHIEAYLKGYDDNVMPPELRDSLATKNKRDSDEARKALNGVRAEIEKLRTAPSKVKALSNVYNIVCK